MALSAQAAFQFLWTGTVKEQRRKLLRLLQQNPSLCTDAGERLADAYGDALAQVERDTGLDESHFPENCPFTLEQVLDERFWPDWAVFGVVHRRSDRGPAVEMR